MADSRLPIRRREPRDSLPSPARSVGSSTHASSGSSFAAISILGVARKAGPPLRVRVAGEHGRDLFLVRIDEIGLAQAAGSPPGDSSESVLIGGGRAYVVALSWVDGDDEAVADEWGRTKDLGNAKRFCDADGDLDPEVAGIPSDAWQLAYGKIVAPLPSEDADESGDDVPAVKSAISAPVSARR